MDFKINSRIVPEMLHLDVENLILDRYHNSKIEWENHNGQAFVLSMSVDPTWEENDGPISSMEQKIMNMVYGKA